MERISDSATYEGFVSVGVIEAVVHTWLPEMLKRLRHQFPKVRVEIHSYMTADLHEELLKGNIDLALTAETLENPAIQNSSICGFQMGWIAAPTATEDPHVTDAELLSRLPILTFLRDSLVYRDVVAKLGPYCVARINPISSIAAMVSLARTGYGRTLHLRQSVGARSASRPRNECQNGPCRCCFAVVDIRTVWQVVTRIRSRTGFSIGSRPACLVCRDADRID